MCRGVCILDIYGNMSSVGLGRGRAGFVEENVKFYGYQNHAKGYEDGM